MGFAWSSKKTPLRERLIATPGPDPVRTGDILLLADFDEDLFSANLTLWKAVAIVTRANTVYDGWTETSIDAFRHNTMDVCQRQYHGQRNYGFDKRLQAAVKKASKRREIGAESRVATVLDIMGIATLQSLDDISAQHFSSGSPFEKIILDQWYEKNSVL
jgi:hypothetical protein|tara:strand:+ start:545 stop:1024 length:480 start_codon:yes stop_codon:yes gene_type:complete